MLFLLKRTWLSSLIALAILALAGLALRSWFGAGPTITLTPTNVLSGFAVVAAVLCSDVLLHGLFLLLFGESYRKRHRELVAVFAGQRLPAILAGAAMAGIGEELFFRGVSKELSYLIPAAVVFGLLHHIRKSLWPFTLWSIYQGMLFVVALWWFQDLIVTMVAHFLHDFAGFLIFRWLNAKPQAT